MTPRQLELTQRFRIADISRFSQIAFVEAALELPMPGQLMLLTGPSGSGKSSHLDALLSRHEHVIRIDTLELPDAPVIDCLTSDVATSLRALSAVGLAEIPTLFRTPDRLSVGQRFRLKLAIALERSTPHTLLACDEFTAVLDPLTAIVVSQRLRKIVDQNHLAAIVATSRDDIIDALDPDVVIEFDFGTCHVTRRAVNENT